MQTKKEKLELNKREKIFEYVTNSDEKNKFLLKEIKANEIQKVREKNERKYK